MSSEFESPEEPGKRPGSQHLPILTKSTFLGSTVTYQFIKLSLRPLPPIVLYPKTRSLLPSYTNSDFDTLLEETKSCICNWISEDHAFHSEDVIAELSGWVWQKQLGLEKTWLWRKLFWAGQACTYIVAAARRLHCVLGLSGTSSFLPLLVFCLWCDSPLKNRTPYDSSNCLNIQIRWAFNVLCSRKCLWL